MLAITTAVLMGATPDHATAAQTVSGFKAGLAVSVVVNGLLIVLSLFGLLADRVRRFQPAA